MGGYTSIYRLKNKGFAGILSRLNKKNVYIYDFSAPCSRESIRKNGAIHSPGFFLPDSFYLDFGAQLFLWQTLRTLLNRLDGREDPFKFLRVVEVGHVIDHHGTHLWHRCDYCAFNLINDWHDQRKVDYKSSL